MMDNQESSMHSGGSHKERRSMASRYWQLLLVGLLSLVVNTNRANGANSPRANQVRVQQPKAVSYDDQARQYHVQHLQSAPIDSSPAASNQYSHQQRQPNVYHSIIDSAKASQTALSPAVQASGSTTGDLSTAAGHHHGHAHGKYYEYRAVPKKKTWKFGYKRGNHKHTISRHEHGKAGKHPHFKTKVKWHDSKSKGKGIHLWDYNHHDKKHYHHG